MSSLVAAALALSSGANPLIQSEFPRGGSLGSDPVVSARSSSPSDLPQFIGASEAISIISLPADELQERFTLKLSTGTALVGKAHTVAEGAGGARFSDDGRYLIVWGATRVTEGVSQSTDRGYLNLIDLSNPRRVTTHSWSFSPKVSNRPFPEVSDHISDVAFLKGSSSFVCQIPLLKSESSSLQPMGLSLIDSVSKRVVSIGEFERPVLVRFSPFAPSALVYDGGTASAWEPRMKGAAIFITPKGGSAPVVLQEAASFLGWTPNSGDAVFVSNRANGTDENVEPWYEIFNPHTGEVVSSSDVSPETKITMPLEKQSLEVVTITELGTPMAGLRSTSDPDGKVIFLDANVEPKSTLLSQSGNAVVSVDAHGTARLRFIQESK